MDEQVWQLAKYFVLQSTHFPVNITSTLNNLKKILKILSATQLSTQDESSSFTNLPELQV